MKCATRWRGKNLGREGKKKEKKKVKSWRRGKVNEFLEERPPSEFQHRLSFFFLFLSFFLFPFSSFSFFLYFFLSPSLIKGRRHTACLSTFFFNSCYLQETACSHFLLSLSLLSSLKKKERAGEREKERNREEREKGREYNKTGQGEEEEDGS